MKTLLWIAGAIIVVVALLYVFTNYNGEQAETSMNTSTSTSSVQVVPISHATAVLKWGDTVFYTDPTGGAEAFQGQPAADIVLVTDIHGDHLSTSTLEAVVGTGTTLVVPQAVKDLLPESLASRAKVLANGENLAEREFKITALPMYNLPGSSQDFHTKGRGNGYVIGRDDTHVYIAGDTAGTPEMRGLTGIDIALVPMNLPYTMSVEEAADAVLAFKPAQVYPYHYRGPDGLSDINKFKQLVNAGDSGVEVVLLNWYP
ncbi:MBL fold metallo-hydrolase [Candidatus Kaiserbacteria bacterium RIFCSPHIGHO2_01_FULL_54_36]|uniref:MBL fold metallo-hydrolase n=1 Tax=Candidatus Kaiserbacteria bacterium RIFCSPHIGHO2_01_FULL_54_36 TaxID=1798482 RepID=A0A1F6CMI4_9BACT|nr:MAG: MBL fold metallo-hydrolase [Candidatus Kaiserbacteria bacterium RIFCSPHIGHO2_01_FULL_54_36]OGG75770.1 MAG: MBL fold metallo-hydrolase [Candidatus Kaiserbacteria bacterium RIFCSPLOWO2_01_FULL_54_22]